MQQADTQKRAGFGEERYENEVFQQRVRDSVRTYLCPSHLKQIAFHPVLQYQALYASMQAIQPRLLDVTGLSIEDAATVVWGAVQQLVESEAPRDSESKTLW